MSTYLVPIAVILVLIVINGVFVAAEFALVSSRRSRFESLAQDGNSVARWLVGVFDKPMGKDAYIAIAQLGITLASIGLGMYGEPAVAAWLYPTLESWGLSYGQSHAVGFVLALGAITYLHVVFGEMIPKALALQVPETVSIAVNPVMRAFGFVFRPMVKLLNWLAFGLMRMLGIPEPDKASMLYTSAELAIATEEVAASGQFGKAQRTLIDNIFEMEDRTAEELMTSRAKLVAIAVDTPIDEVAALIAESRQARYPVHAASLDKVLGVMHVKDFIKAHHAGDLDAIRPLIRPLARVSATTPASELLALFKTQRVHAALVVNEFGGTLGFVTMDDIIDDLIDADEPATSDWIQQQPDGSLLLDGEVTLAELAEDHDIHLDEPGVVTVAGLFFAIDGTMPKADAVLERDGYRLQIVEMQGSKVTRVRVVAA
jgi:CBS domain containing-hemolysin-like protein